jgi:hypothetical protein
MKRKRACRMRHTCRASPVRPPRAASAWSPCVIADVDPSSVHRRTRALDPADVRLFVYGHGRRHAARPPPPSSRVRRDVAAHWLFLWNHRRAVVSWCNGLRNVLKYLPPIRPTRLIMSFPQSKQEATRRLHSHSMAVTCYISHFKETRTWKRALPRSYSCVSLLICRKRKWNSHIL